MKPWMIACAILACAPATARAGQCALVDDATAARAREVLDRHPDVVSYCEPCSDVAPEPPVHVTRTTSRRGADGVDGVDGVELVLDGRAINLAYTYVQTSSHRYENLAALVGCPTTGVSPSLAIDDATSTGVLIHADRTPVREPFVQRITPPLATTPSSSPAPPAPPPAIYVVTSERRMRIGWDAVFAACVATAVIWWLGSGVRRRRRAMRPRATDL